MHSLLDVGTLKSRRGKKVHPADHGVVNISAAVTKNTDAAVNVTASTLSIQLSSQQQQQEDAFTSFSNSSSPTAGGAPRRKLNNSNSKHQRGNTLERGVNLRPSNTAAGGLGGDTPNSSWQKTRSALPGSSSSRESLEANFPSGHQKLEFMTEG